MNDIALAALKESIAHWEDNFADPSKANIAGSACALCALYFKAKTGGNACDGCPIKEFTGQQYCIGTPYTSCSDCEPSERYVSDEELETFQEAIKAELEFLRSLLPP